MSEIDVERLAHALYNAQVQHVMHSYSYTNREIAAEIAAAYADPSSDPTWAEIKDQAVETAEEVARTTESTAAHEVNQDG